MIKYFLFLLSILVASFAGSDVAEGEGDGAPSKIDQALDSLDQVLKSKSDSDIRDILSNPESKAKVLDILKAESDDDDDENDRYSKCADGYKKDSKGSYMKVGDKYIKDKNMKKSFEGIQDDLDDTIEEHENVIDAVPVLKSFAEIQSKLIKCFESLESKVDNSIEKSIQAVEVSKAIATVTKEQIEMTKSIDGNVDTLKSAPGNIPGKINQDAAKTDVLIKGADTSGEGEDMFKSVKSASLGLIKSICLEGFKDGEKVSSNTISRIEMSGSIKPLFNRPNELQYVNNKINGGN